MTDYSWISSADGDWSDTGVWNPAGVPSASDSNATIDAAGTYTVEINNSEGFSVSSVTLNSAGATLAVNGTLSLNSGFSIKAGQGITGDGFLFVTGGSIGGGTVSVSSQDISGNVALSANLMDTGTVSLGSSSTDTFALGAHKLTLTGAGSIIVGKLTGTGMLALAGGDQRIDAGASLGMKKLSMSGGDSLSVTTDLTYAGTLTQAAGTSLSVEEGKALTLTGGASLSGAVSGAFNVNGGSLMLDTAGAAAELTVNGASVSVARDLTYSGTLTDKGSAIALGGKTLTLTGKASLTNITVMTAGTLMTKGATAVLGISIKAGAQLLNLGKTIAHGQITLGDNTTAGTIVNGAGATLALTNGIPVGSALGASMRGSAGVSVNVIGKSGSTLRNKGRILLTQGGGRGGVRGGDDHTSHIAVTFQNLSTGRVSVQSGTLEFDAAFTNANTNAGTVLVASSAVLDFNGGGSSSAGVFKVAAGGLLEFTGGTFTLSAGTIQGGTSVTGGMLALGTADVTISGGFTQAGSSVISGSGVLMISGAASFSGTGVAGQTGAGQTVLMGTTSVAKDIAIDNGRVFENDGTLTWTGGNFELGRTPAGASGSGGFLRNKGTFNIAYDGVIGGYGGDTAFINRGTITKGNAGTVLVTTELLNQGTVNLSRGTLRLGNTVFGDGGSFHISNGAILATDKAVAAKQTVAFGSGGGKLIVRDAAEFAAKISGFGAQTAIDITTFKFSGKPTVSFVEAGTNKQGVLTVTDGAQTLKLTLFGQYVSAGFHLGSDGAAGGTLVTYVPPPAAHNALATPH